MTLPPKGNGRSPLWISGITGLRRANQIRPERQWAYSSTRVAIRRKSGLMLRVQRLTGETDGETETPGRNHAEKHRLPECGRRY